MRLADLNASIKRLIDKNRIKEGIDYIDLLSETVSLRDFAKENGLIGSNKTSVVFVLSEREYSKLIKSMDDDKSWDIMNKLIDEYFTMREIINSDEQLKTMYLLKAVESTGEESAIAIKSYSDLRIKESTKPLLNTIDKQNDTIKHKEDIIIDLTKGLSIAEKRQRITQIIRYNANGKFKERYYLLYEEFSKNFMSIFNVD